MTSISQTPRWFKTARSQAGKSSSRAYGEFMKMATRFSNRDYVADPLQVVERIWRLRRWQSSWLQLY